MTNRAQLLGRALVVSTIVVIGLLVYVVITSVQTLRTTGDVHITAFAKDASISISQNNKEAKQVGVGTAHLRLKPGEYELAASHAGQSGTQLINVTKQKRLDVRISNNAQYLPSPSSVTFNGIDALTANGLTSTQTANLRYLFFTYKQKAKVVNIDPSSVEPEYHDPNSADPTFVIDFSGDIDSVPFTATVSYADLANVKLTLFDAQGNQLFSQDSSASPLS